MVFGPHRQSFIGGVQTGAPGDGPAEQDAVQLQAKVVMQPRCVVLLNQVRPLVPARPRLLRARLRRMCEIALTSILLKGHVSCRISSWF
jgi:hypothetical protein